VQLVKGVGETSESGEKVLKCAGSQIDEGWFAGAIGTGGKGKKTGLSNHPAEAVMLEWTAITS